MCGIAGLWTEKTRIDERIVLQMQGVLRHRGPDDRGIELSLNKRVALINTRLSIIDLTSACHQPMWNQDQTLSLDE